MEAWEEGGGSKHPREFGYSRVPPSWELRSLLCRDTTAAATVVSVSGVLVSDQGTSVSEPRRSVSPSFGTGLVSFGPNSAQFYMAGAAVSFLFSLTQKCYLLNRVSLS